MLHAVSNRGIVLLGCGKMGSALLEGWFATGLDLAAITVIDPAPSPRLQELAGRGLRLNAGLPAQPAVAVLAVKPQMMQLALPRLAALGRSDTLVLSIAAGTTLGVIESILGIGTAVVRAMPNTPASVGRSITALIGNAWVDEASMQLAETLMQAVGQTVRLQTESQMDAVTAVSGSGPAYVFLLIEALATAGEAEGLSPDLALHLARATVAGAGVLAETAVETPTQLRDNVTSPAGTTAAALSVLIQDHAGLPDLIRRAVAAAAHRSRELGG